MKRTKCLFQLSTLMAIFLSGCSDIIPAPDYSSPMEIQIQESPTAATIPPPTDIQPVLGDPQVRQTDGMVMIYVPAGEFTMGSDHEEVDFALQQCQVHGTNCQRRYFSVEMPSHQVVLDGFWLDQTDVTSSEYAQCEGAGVCEAPGCQSGGVDFPVVCVNWEQAASYCHWAVGSYPQGASWVGALDWAGNVWEMVADWNGEYLPGEQVNPAGPLTGSRRVARGGSRHASPDHVRSALRTHLGVIQQFNHAGFRCAKSTP
jgi:formylglycine-generating enzyme required for sulfatase activity